MLDRAGARQPSRRWRRGVAGPAGGGEDRGGRRVSAPHRLGDALALERVDQPGGVADEEHPALPRTGADHAHLEPAAEPVPQQAGDGSEEARVAAGGRGTPRSAGRPARRRRDRRACRAPRPTLARPPDAREQPSVARESRATGVGSHRTMCGSVDRVVDVGADGEAPDHPVAGRRGPRPRRPGSWRRRRRSRRRREAGAAG